MWQLPPASFPAGFPFSQNLQSQSFPQGWGLNPDSVAFAHAHTPWGLWGGWLSKGQGRKSGVGGGGQAELEMEAEGRSGAQS